MNNFLKIGLAGDESMLCVVLLLGVDITQLLALMQGLGTALRLDRALFSRRSN